jgi:hypothetical protein
MKKSLKIQSNDHSINFKPTALLTIPSYAMVTQGITMAQPARPGAR